MATATPTFEVANAFWEAVAEGRSQDVDACAQWGRQLAPGVRQMLALHGSRGHAALWSGVPGSGHELGPGFRGPMALHARVGGSPDWAAANPCAVVGLAALGQPLPLQHVAAWAAAAYALTAPDTALQAVHDYATAMAAQAHAQQGQRARELLAVGAAQARNLAALRSLLEPWTRVAPRAVVDAWPGRDACGPSLALAVVAWHPTPEDAARVVALCTPAALAAVDAARAAARQPACALDQAAVDGRHELVAQMLDVMGPGEHVAAALRAAVAAARPDGGFSEAARDRAVVVATLASRAGPEQLYEARESVLAAMHVLRQGAPLTPAAAEARSRLAAAAAALAAATVPGVLLPGASAAQAASTLAAQTHEESGQQEFCAAWAVIQRRDGEQARILELERIVERQRKEIEQLEARVGELEAQAEAVGEAAIAELHQLMSSLPAAPTHPIAGGTLGKAPAAVPVLARSGAQGSRHLH